jgi:hypothetical protein
MTGEEFRGIYMQRLLPRRKRKRAEIPHPSLSEAPIANQTLASRTDPKNLEIYERKRKEGTRTDRTGKG